MKNSLLIALVGFSVITIRLNAEPWMASRFAQNCAACHAPGRVNPPQAKDRSCSFSCQSCHTNPNGGGLRNLYGKWNQERWLRSTYIADYKLNKPRPAPAGQQPYSEEKLKAYMAGVKDPKDIERLERDGARLAESTQDLPASEYDHRSNPAPTVEDKSQALLRVPQGDPYRETKASYFNAGVDLRWYYLRQTTNSVTKTGIIPKLVDVAASVDPTKNISLVWESRFLTDPLTNSVWDETYTTGADQVGLNKNSDIPGGAQVRSAYVKVDDLPYNGYAMYGIYRPMFGSDGSDPTTVFARSTDLDERRTYKAGGVGFGRNLLANVNILEPFADHKMPQDRGVVFNVGGHFKRLNSYLYFSWWDTKSKDWTTDNLTTFRRQAFTGGVTKGRTTIVGSITNMLIDENSVRRDSGTLIAVEPRVRTWGETYVKGGYEYLNTALDLRNGKVAQYGLGVSSFIVSGVELEIMYKDMRATRLGVETKETNVWSQLHLFF